MKITKYISEIFSLVNQENEESEKIRILRENNSPSLIQICRFAYDSSYKSLISVIPKYRIDDSPYGYSYSDLLKECHRLNYFFDYPGKNKNWNVNEKQRNKILLNILERIHWADAAILTNILKTKNIPNISLDLLTKAFPVNFKVEQES